MGKGTLGCQECQDFRVSQALQVFLGLLAHLALQDSLVFPESQDLEDLRVTWVIM